MDYREQSARGARPPCRVLVVVATAASAGTAQTIYPDGRCELIVHLAPRRVLGRRRRLTSAGAHAVAAQRVVARFAA